MKDDSEASSEFIVQNLGITPVYIPDMKREIDLVKDRSAYRKIRDLIDEFKPHIVHTHAAKAGTLGRLAASRSKVPIVLHTFHGHVFHSYFNPIATRTFIQIERYLAKRSTRIIAISDIQKQELGIQHKICPSEKIEVIPLGFDLERFREDIPTKRELFRQKYALAADEVAVGIIGRLVAVKNHDLFIKAWKQVLEKSKTKKRAFIIGDGEDRTKIEEMARQAGIKFSGTENAGNGEDLVFTSWITNIDEALAGLDLVALTSLNEGTPVSLIEAQAAGKAIVTTNVGGIGNVVIPDRTALLSSSGDVDKFAKNLTQLIDDKELRIAFGAAGWENVQDKFHVNRLVKDMESLYRKLLTEKGFH